jgi:hypothetical protein
MMDILSCSKALSLSISIGRYIAAMDMNTYFEPLTSGMKAKIDTRYRAPDIYQSNLSSAIIIPVPNKFSASHLPITAKKGGHILAKRANHHVAPY